MSQPSPQPDFSYLIKNKSIKLSEHQNNAIQRMINRRTITLAFQPGLGKTLTSLVAGTYFVNKYPEKAVVVIFSPKSARNAFLKELSTKLQVDFAFYNADKNIEYTDQKYIVIEHTVVEKYIDFIKELSKTKRIVAIVDEAHFLRAAGSKLTNIMKDLSGFFTVLYLLTATPLGNDFQELYTFMSFMDPKIPNWFQFRNYYCKVYAHNIKMKNKRGVIINRRIFDIVDYKNIEQLKKYISNYMIFGSKSYNINHEIIYVQLDEYLRQPYIDAAKGMLDSEKKVENFNYEFTDEAKAFGGRLHDLQRIVDNCQEEYAREAPSNKERALLSLLKRISDRNESALVFVLYDDSVERMTKLLEHYKTKIGMEKIHVLSGKTKEDDRATIETTLKEKEVVIITQAGRQSRNLQRASNIIYYDQSFSTSDYIQIMGRITRTDTKYQNLHSYVICVKDTIDEYKKKIFEDNAWIIKEIFGNYGNAIPLCLHKIDRMNSKKLKNDFLWKFTTESFKNFR